MSAGLGGAGVWSCVCVYMLALGSVRAWVWMCDYVDAGGEEYRCVSLYVC